MPTKIVFGKYEFNNIEKYINNRKVFIITSKGFEKRGIIEKIKSSSKSVVGFYSDIKPYPQLKDLEIANNIIHKKKFDLFLAVGGGSVLDSTKYFSIKKQPKNDNLKLNITNSDNLSILHETIPIISVPTTAGTGSELTPWATIWDFKEKKKDSLFLPNLFSELALYDPTLTLSLPKKLTIQTSLDALSHSFESIWNKNSNPISTNFAIKSAKIILSYLPLLVKDLNNLEKREKILEACMYSGLAFSNTQTAIAHSMSYYITLNKGIDHGIACSFTLPLIIDNIIGKYRHVDESIEEIFGELSSRPLRKWFKKLNISMRFQDYNISKNELENMFVSMKNNQRFQNSLLKSLEITL